MSDVVRITDSVKRLAKSAIKSGTYFTTATVLNSGATSIKLDSNGRTVEGNTLFIAKTVESISVGKTVIVAVSDDSNAYYVLDELI